MDSVTISAPMSIIRSRLRPRILFGLLVAMLALTACENNMSDEEIEEIDEMTRFVQSMD